MENAETYQVHLEVFEGPLDLLLFLIRKKKIDIQDIPIAAITKEYLQYLNQKEKINLNREAEFLFMAALLIYIKSQLLLPRPQPQEEGEDLRQPLVDQLLEHQKIKAICSILREREEEQLQLWKRTTFLPFPEDYEPSLVDVSLFDLAEAFFSLMKRKEKENFKIIPQKNITLEKKMDEILAILNERKVLDFLDYFNIQETLEEAVLSFFSLLELIRLKVVIAIQEQLFHSIKVWLRKDKGKKRQ